MDNQKTCADCINLGSEVYCVKCKRLKNGYKDMFVEQSKTDYINTVYQKTYQAARSLNALLFEWTNCPLFWIENKQ